MSSTLTDISSSGPNYGVDKSKPPAGGFPTADVTDATGGYNDGSSPPTTPKPGQTGVMTVMNPDQIAAAATSQITNEINDQVSPLQSQFDTTSAQEDRTRQAIESMFGSIQPFVAGAAANVQQSYDQASQAEQGIFSAAMTQLNQLKQQRAQEAQALAQEMGGPVALSEFEGGVGQNQTMLANLGAGQMLHTLAYGQAGVQEANAWSGRVFPLIQTEEQAKARNYFEDKKRELQDQITSLKQSAGSKIEQRKNDLLVQEREFQLKKIDQQLQQVKDNRDWKATLRQLKNDNARLTLAQQQQKLDEAGTTGTYKGKPTLAARQLTAQEKQQAAQLGMDEKTYLLNKQQLESSTKMDRQKLAATNRATWAQYLDSALSPSPGKSVKVTQWVPTGGDPGLAGIRHPEQFQKVNGKWYHKVDTNIVQNGAAPITNPGALVDFLVAHNVPKKIAVNMVKTRLRLPNWVYGQGDPNAPVGSGGRSQPGGYTRPG